MRINKHITVSKSKHKTLRNILRIDLSNANETESTIFSINNLDIENKVNAISIRLKPDTARKLAEALLNLSKGK